jgi:hypothetical protein
MENVLEKRELVAMLMESPFYFDLRVRERLALVRQHHRRFSPNIKAGQSGPAQPKYIKGRMSSSPRRVMPANP